MKATVYLRVGKKAPGTRGPEFQVAATTTPSPRPLENTVGAILPTAAFAIEIDIPDDAFETAARVVAKLKVPEERLKIAAEVLELDP